MSILNFLMRIKNILIKINNNDIRKKISFEFWHTQPDYYYVGT